MDKATLLDNPIEKPLTLREKIVEYIKDAVVSGRLKPGERVPEQEIAEALGISRTPIREAFRQLESEGFISITPRKGAVVSPITDKDVTEFYEIKSLLEGYAARLACPKFSDKDLAGIEAINKKMHRCSERGDVKGFFKLDNEFHDIFLRACGNSRLYTLVHQIVAQFERFRVTALSIEGRMAVSIKQHAEIIKAFKESNTDLVERLVKDNAEMSEQFLVKNISKENI